MTNHHVLVTTVGKANRKLQLAYSLVAVTIDQMISEDKSLCTASLFLLSLCSLTAGLSWSPLKSASNLHGVSAAAKSFSDPIDVPELALDNHFDGIDGTWLLVPLRKSAYMRLLGTDETKSQVDSLFLNLRTSRNSGLFASRGSDDSQAL